jgi:hypothetical protein
MSETRYVTGRAPCQKQPPFPLVPARIRINRDQLCKSHLANVGALNGSHSRPAKPPAVTAGDFRC